MRPFRLPSGKVFCREIPMNQFIPHGIDIVTHTRIGSTHPAPPVPGTSGFKECQQVGVELIFMCVRQAVGRARVDLERRVPDQLR
jgi:hypothetical protein